jgi:cell division transport system permease protein
MTILVIAVALSLPMVLHKVVQSMQGILDGWQGHSEISLFLHAQVDGVEVAPVDFGQSLMRNPVIEDVRYISPDDGLRQLEDMPGIREAVSLLPENPLPPLLVVRPAGDLTADESGRLADELNQMPEIDIAVYDQRWLHRLEAILDLLGRGVLVLSALTGIGVLLVVSNTVRLGIGSRAAEIDIIDQVGGTRAFIRRPFLYTGAIQCLFGAMLAWAFSNLVLMILFQPVSRLANLYHSEFELGWIDPVTAAWVCTGSLLLGLIAARMTVDHYFGTLRPR